MQKQSRSFSPSLPGRSRRLPASIGGGLLALLSALLLLSPSTLAAQSPSFGHAVLVDGDRLLVAEPTPTFRPGAVYIYEQSGGGWRESDRLHAPGSERADGFGTLLAQSGNTLFVGQRGGPIHIFHREAGSWRVAGAIADPEIEGLSPACRFDGYCGTDFGLTLAASDDWLLVGVPGTMAGDDSRPGVVYAYQQSSGGHWVRRAQLQPAEALAGDGFGATIAFTQRGVLIGAPGWDSGDGDGEDAGRVYHFGRVDGGWQEESTLAVTASSSANFGAALAVAGDRILVGAPGRDGSRGAVFMHRWSAEMEGWEAVGEPLVFAEAEEGDRFGAAVAFAGNDIWVGAPTTRGLERGSVFLYQAQDDGAMPATPRRIRLPREETVALDRFGGLVVAGAEGEVVAVGAPGMHHQAGSVHLFGRGDGWSEDGEMLVSAPDALGAMTGEEQRCTEGRIGLFDCDEVELLAYIPPSLLRAEGSTRGVRTNDNWGWTDSRTGREYALVGRNDGTSFIDITDPANPVLVGDLPKTPDTPPSQLWRDIKTYRDHAFIVADAAGDHGMQIFDLARLREVAPGDMPALFEPDVLYTQIASSHNIVINEETGFAYAVGSGGGGEACGGGLHMIDIRDPKNPIFAGCGSSDNIHDSQCVIYQGPDARYRDREICLNSNGNLFQITDITDKDNPVEVATASSPNPAYIHQGWLTDDHRYFYQDDESDVAAGNVETTRTLIWDLSDLEDPVLVHEFMGSMPASAHNLYIVGDLVYQANYRYGLHILDISDPENPREVGAFDTSPYQEGPGFGGAWSNYPYFPSGTVIVTSMQEGLFVLRKRVRPVS